MINSYLRVALLLVLTVPAFAQSGMPILKAVEPASGSYGDVLTVTGENLSQSMVAALYLTDGKTDIKLVILEQTDASIKFRIPTGIAKGRFALMVLTQGKDAKFIEEPVKVAIEPSQTGPTS